MVRHTDYDHGIYALLRANRGLVMSLLWAVPWLLNDWRVAPQIHIIWMISPKLRRGTQKCA
jgi:hypothetical protein